MKIFNIAIAAVAAFSLSANSVNAFEGFRRHRVENLASENGDITFTPMSEQGVRHAEGYVYGPEHLLFIRTFRVTSTGQNASGKTFSGTFNESNSIPTRGNQNCNGDFTLYAGVSGDYILEMNYQKTRQPFDYLSCDVEGRSFKTEMNSGNWLNHYGV